MADLGKPVDLALGARIAALRPDLDRMQLPACILDHDFVYRYVNAAYLGHFGRDAPGDFLGKTADAAFQIVPTDGRRLQLRRALAGETVVFDRATIEGPNAGRWVRAHYLPVHDGEAVIGVLVISVDIQHLKDVERDLEQRERQLHLINESVGVPMAYVDSTWRFRYCNRAGHNWRPGLAAPDVSGKHLKEVFTPEAFAVIRPNIEQAFRGERVEYERLGTSGDGEPRWIRVHLIPDVAADGGVRGVYSIVIDVDDDHRLRDALLEQESELRFFAENIPGPIAFVDAEFRYRFVNNNFLRLNGSDISAIIGQPVRDVFGPELAPRFFEPFVERLRRGESCEYERLVATAGGESRWHLVRLVPHMVQGNFDGYYVVGTDVHDLKVAQDGLRAAQGAIAETERQLREVIDAIPTPMCYVDDTLHYRYVNRSFLEYIGMPAGRVIGHSVQDVLGEERFMSLKPGLDRVRAGEALTVERMIRFADGRERWMHVRLTPRHDAAGRYLGYFATTSDVHDQKLVEEELRRASTVLSAHIDNTPLAVLEFDTDMRLVRWSGQAERTFGWSASEVLGRNLSGWRFVYEDDTERVSHQINNLFDGSRPHATLVNRNYRKDGSVIWVEWHNSALRDDEGRVISLLALAQDVSSRMRAEEKLVYLATHDGLTDLPNRVVLNDRLASAVARARRSGHDAVVMFLDLDRFKDVNDTLGHRVGDMLLQELARRLRAALRESDLIARISGDEFVIVLEDLATDEPPDRVAAKVLDEARRPFAIEGHEIHVSASLGIARFPEDGQDAEDLLKNADAAMYAAKELGRNSFRLYSPELAARRTRRLETEAALRRALKEGQLLLHYQPIVELAGGSVARAEALLRWNDPERGLQMPTAFLPLAEETGLAHELGSWVLEEACRQVRAWRDSGAGPLVVSVNLSPAQLRDSSMVPSLERTLAATGCEPSWLELEITETSMVRDLEGVRLTLSRLRALGVRVAIDDFGTGFSSLSHLRHLPVDVLKIDRSFVADIEAGAQGRPRPGTSGAAIVSSILGLARGLGLEVVAEGIEKKSQLAFLAREGCAFGQGFLFCAPMAAPDFTRWLAIKGSDSFIRSPRVKQSIVE